MSLGTHAQGYVGIAFEATYGTFVPATRFFPIKSESIAEVYENQPRRLIRGIADNMGRIAGWSRVEGDITMELLPDVLPYFLYVSRNTVVKTGANPNLIYTTTPAHFGATSSLPVGKKGMSITVVKNGEAFGYQGCVTTGIEIGVDNGIPSLKITIIGQAENTVAPPAPTYVTTDTPFGAGQYSIEIPTAAQVFDTASFTFTVNDNGEAQNRLMNNRYAQWVKFGQREVSLQIERDFTTRAELDVFKALTARSITIACTKTVNTSVAIKLPVATHDTYEHDGLSDQGQATMMRATFGGDYDPVTSKSYEIVCKCQTDIA